jgi:hypothetical protein
MNMYSGCEEKVEIGNLPGIRGDGPRGNLAILSSHFF